MYSNESDELKQQVEQLQEEVKKWKEIAGNLYEAIQQVRVLTSDQENGVLVKLSEALDKYEDAINETLRP